VSFDLWNATSLAIVASAAVLLIAEIRGILSDREGDTISEGIRTLLVRHPTSRFLSAGAWIVFAVWFFVHIWFPSVGV
jgi:hypothetical protein